MPSTWVNGRKASAGVKENSSFLMVPTMSAIGLMIKLTVKVDLYIQMEILIQAIGEMIVLKVQESLFMKMVLLMMANGKMIFNMAMEMKNGLMELNMWDSIKRARSIIKAFSLGRMVQFIMVILLIIIFLEKVFIIGLMVENMRVNG